MSDEKRFELLLSSLQGHEISFNQKHLQKAMYTQKDAAVETWIDEHLGPETLLTKEELSLYLRLEESGESSVLASSQDLSSRKGVCDNDIKNAVDQLRKSTIKIEKQIETLRTQQEAIAALVKANGENLTAHLAAESARSKAWTTEYNQVSSAVDELLQNLQYQIAELRGAGRTAETGLRTTALEILKLDDKILLGLQRLASDLDPGSHDADVVANRVRDLCARLIKYTVEGTRTRLNRIYLEIAADGEGTSKGNESAENEEVVALLDELESLYAEILPVAQISAEQQYLEPAFNFIAMYTSQGGDRSTKALNYISNCLSNLIQRLQDFAVNTEEFNSYRAATALMANAVKFEADTDRPRSPKARLPSSPTRLRKQSKPISPVRPRNTRRRSSAASFDDDANPELQILRNLGISLGTESTNERSITTALQDITADRETKLDGHMKSLEEVSEASIGSQLHDSQITLQLLVDSLLCETPYHSVSLVDKEVQEALVRLEKGIDEVKRETAAVSLDFLTERNVRRDNLMERWAR